MNQRELFRVEGLPVLQNRMYETAAAAREGPQGDVILVQDLGTGLIHNAAFDEALLHYGADYQNEQAFSGVFQKHLDDVGGTIHRHFQDLKIIEVGCGKGYFLEYLQKAGYNITGIDPAYEGKNPRVVKARFESRLGLSADGIVLRHVLEHMADPMAFLAAIAAANGGKGLIYIEVPCFDWICRHRAWFDIFYEHVNYFRLVDFHRMFGKVRESGHVFGGQYLYVVADISSLQQPRLMSSEEFDFPSDFLASIAHSVDSANNRSVTIWGGASKGVIFALSMARAGITIDQVIDINPAKQGKFLAGTGLQVRSPQEGVPLLAPGDNVFIMNSNYLQEIIAMTKNQFNYIQVDRHGI